MKKILLVAPLFLTSIATKGSAVEKNFALSLSFNGEEEMRKVLPFLYSSRDPFSWLSGPRRNDVIGLSLPSPSS